MKKHILDISSLASTKDNFFLIDNDNGVIFRVENKKGAKYLKEGTVNFGDPNFYDDKYNVYGKYGYDEGSERKLQFDNKEDMITFKLKYL